MILVPWPTILWLVFTMVGCAVLLLFLGSRNEQAIRRDWELLLTPQGEQLYRRIEGRVHGEMALAAITFEEAFSMHELGTVEEARLLLDVGYRVIARFSPNMMRLLSAMAGFSRMVSAMAPVRPLRPADFKLSQLANLAYLNGILHQFLVSTAERYRLKLYILGRSFDLGARFLLESTRRIARGDSEADREWEQIKAIRDDFQTLTDESLDGLKMLLTSLAAERRDDVLARL